jgi:hypothetical protein
MLLGSFMVAGPTAAQDGEGFPLTAFAAYCPPDNAGPFVGCTPWDGVTVTFVAIDTDYSATCVTETGDRAASCAVVVPFGSTIEASIDPATVPAGYVLRNPTLQQLTIPDGPPEGVFGGPTFILEEAVVEQPEEVPPVIDEEPVVDEGEEYVPPIVGDEPQTDPEPAEVTSLPSTGTGATGASPLMPLLLAGVAAFLSLGSYRLRHLIH